MTTTDTNRAELEDGRGREGEGHQKGNEMGQDHPIVFEDAVEGLTPSSRSPESQLLPSEFEEKSFFGTGPSSTTPLGKNTIVTIDIYEAFDPFPANDIQREMQRHRQYLGQEWSQLLHQLQDTIAMIGQVVAKTTAPSMHAHEEEVDALLESIVSLEQQQERERRKLVEFFEGLKRFSALLE